MASSELKDALMHLAEECCELGKASSKIYRFGPEHAKKPGGSTNKERLYEEYEDVRYWMNVVTTLIDGEPYD